jgi:hypothetical protein
MYGVDRMQQMVGKGIEVAGDLTGIEGVKQYGTDMAAQQEKDIAAGGYQPQYPGSLRENYNQGTFLPALGEKLLENAPSGGAAIAGTGLTAAAAALGAPAWLVFGGGAAVTAGSGLMGAGEAAMEMEEKTGSYDSKVAAGVGALVGFLDRFGAGKVIPVDRLAGMSADEVIKELSQKGFGEAAQAYAGRVTKAAAAEGATEVAQETAIVGGAASQGAEYTGQELADRAIDASVLGSAYGGGTRAVTELAPTANATREAGAQRLTELGDVLNPVMIGNDPQAATELATRLDTIAKANDLNLKDVNKQSTSGAREAVDKAHIQVSEELKQLAKDLRTQLGITDSDELSVVLDKVMAIAGQRQARNKAKSTVGVQEMQAIDRLAGSTQEGQRMLSLMRQMNELTTLHNSGYVGGVSKITDQLSPIPSNVGYSDRSLIETPTRILGTLYGASVNPVIPAIQGAAVIGGRGIDAVTGRRSRVATYIKDNINKNEGIKISDDAESVRETRRQETEGIKKANQEQRARAKEIHKSQYEKNGDLPFLKLDLMLKERGLSPQRAVKLLEAMAAADPVIAPDAQAMIKAIQEGGRTPNMTAVGAAMSTALDQQSTSVTRDKTPVPGAAQAAASSAAAPRDVSAGYVRGIQDNQAANTALIEAVDADPMISDDDKAVLIDTLADLRSNLGSNPADRAMDIAAKAESQVSDPALVETYVMPYVNRVIGQQTADSEPTINLQAEVFESPYADRIAKREALKEEAKASPLFNAWTKPNRERVLNATYDRRSMNAEARRATVEAIAREARKRGFEVYYTSTSKDGRSSSRYINLPNDRKARIADHDLPDTNQRQFNRDRGIGVYDVEIIPDDWDTTSLDEYFEEMLYDEYADTDPVLDLQRDALSPALENASDVFGIGSDIGMTAVSAMPTDAEFTEMQAGTFKPTQKKKLEVAYGDYHKAWKQAAGTDAPLEYTPENIDRISKMMATEALRALQRDDSAIGWYDAKLKAAKSVMRLVEPRIFDNEAAFDFALAVTSNGQAVIDNFAQALEVFRGFVDTGVMPENWNKGGERKKAMQTSFKFFNAYQSSGTNMPIDMFLDTDFTVKELSDWVDQFNNDYGTNISMSVTENMDTTVKGSFILGAKIGQGFYQNVRGNYDPLTMDIWWMRMWNRLIGRPFKPAKSAADMQKNRNIIVEQGLDAKDGIEKQLVDATLQRLGTTRSKVRQSKGKIDDFSRELNRTWNSYYSRYQKENGTNPVKPQLFKTVGTHFKNLAPELQATPTSGGERSYMRDVTARARELLSEQGYDINTADFQALMWYPEKQLAQKMGVAKGKGDDNDYLDAAIEAATKEGISNDQIQEALPEAERARLFGGTDTRQQDVSSSAVVDRVSGAQEPTIDYQRRIGDGVASSPAEPGEIRDQLAVTEQLFAEGKPVPIGLPGSPFENGIQDLRVVEKLAKALEYAFEIYANPNRMNKDLKERFNSKGVVKGFTGGFLISRDIDPSSMLVDRTTGERIRGKIGVLDVYKNPKGTKKNSQADVIWASLHELGHAIERRSFITENIPSPSSTTFNNQDGALRFAYANKKGDPQVYTETFRDFLMQIMQTSSGKPGKQVGERTDINISIEDAQQVINEMINMQRTGVLSISGVGDAVARKDYQTVGQMALNIQNNNNLNDSQKAQREEKLRQDLLKYETIYFQTMPELAADMIGMYMSDPKGFKQRAPAAAAITKQLLNQANSPTSGLVKFYSMPLATVVAIIMANLLAGEREEEEQNGMLNLGRGALTA